MSLLFRCATGRLASSNSTTIPEAITESRGVRDAALGIERMMHGVEALEGELSKDDKGMLKKVLISEANWLTDKYEVVGGLDAGNGLNRPESNLWNGALLHRIASMYPDTPRASEYKEKGSKFLINSVSLPSDETSDEIVDGKPVRERFAGANFFKSLSLDHHAYLNVGYMVICISNAAMLHFHFKGRGRKAPESLWHHLRELWHLIRKFTFPDGRLIRIGGDTKARYCYCQDYMVPSWILAADSFGDITAPTLEREWLKQTLKEQSFNKDGSFLSKRCSVLRERSQLYYTRLESDKACSLSFGAYWRDKFDVPSKAEKVKPESFSWSESFHGAAFQKDANRVASWVCRAAEGPCGIFVPGGSGDMAEWNWNLAGRCAGQGRKSRRDVLAHRERVFDGGFMASCKFESISEDFAGEGTQAERQVLQHSAFAALPDSSSAIVMQKAHTLLRCRLDSVKGLHLLIPNDVFNSFKRRVAPFGGSRARTLKGDLKYDKLWRTGSQRIMVDEKLEVSILYGAKSLDILLPAKRQIGIAGKPEAGGMLKDMEICAPLIDKAEDFDEGDNLFDAGFMLRTGVRVENELFFKSHPSENCRAVAVEGADGKGYFFAVNFGETAEGFELAIKQPLQKKCEGCSVGKESKGRVHLKLEPGGMALFQYPIKE